MQAKNIQIGLLPQLLEHPILPIFLTLKCYMYVEAGPRDASFHYLVFQPLHQGVHVHVTTLSSSSSQRYNYMH